jgi:hypothetical protein
LFGTYGTFGGFFGCRGGDMTPAAIINEAMADGVSLTISPAGTIKATGDGAAVNRWLAVIREHKAEIIDVLKVGAGDTAATSWGWRVVYPEDHPGDKISGRVFECYIVPVQTLAQVQAIHPGAMIEPIAEAAQ